MRPCSGHGPARILGHSPTPRPAPHRTDVRHTRPWRRHTRPQRRPHRRLIRRPSTPTSARGRDQGDAGRGCPPSRHLALFNAKQVNNDTPQGTQGTSCPPPSPRVRPPWPRAKQVCRSTPVSLSNPRRPGRRSRCLPKPLAGLLALFGLAASDRDPHVPSIHRHGGANRTTLVQPSRTPL